MPVSMDTDERALLPVGFLWEIPVLYEVLELTEFALDGTTVT